MIDNGDPEPNRRMAQSTNGRLYDLVKYYYRTGKRRIRASKASWNDRKMLAHFRKRGITDPILLSGFPKSGNHWTRFVVFNYFNVLHNDADRTLTYSELNTLQHHVLGHELSGRFDPAFPVFVRTHDAYRPVFDHFRVVYLYRNPLDALISYYHWHGDRVVPFSDYPPFKRSRLSDIDHFVLSHVDRWVEHYLTTKDKSVVALCYERMKRDPSAEFGRLLTRLGYSLDEDALRRSIELSSIDNVRAMGRRTGQQDGDARPGKFVQGFEFVRSGKIRQYSRRLKPATIERVTDIIDRKGIAIEGVAA